MSTESLMEQVMGAYRERSLRGEIGASPAWHDLEPAEREIAFERTFEQRRLERALDSDGLSTTARAVMARVVGS